MASVTSLQQFAQQHARLWLPGERAPSATPAAAPNRWSFTALAGRLVEISAGEDSGQLTLATCLLAEAQREGDLAAWVLAADSAFYPPDVAAHGVDLAQLAVVRVPTAQTVPRAAARLTHSGAFGLVVLDLSAVPRVPDAQLGRLVQHAQRYETLVLCLTNKAQRLASLGSLVAVRAQATRKREKPDRFVCAVEVLKDKRHGSGWRHEEVVHGAPGLR